MPKEERWTGCGVKRQLRRLKSAEQRAANAQKAVCVPEDGDAIRMYHCPFQQLEQLAGLSPASANLVCTDIPYGKDFLPYVSELADLASRVLVEGGLFVMYSGQYWLPEVMRRLGEHLTYRWMITSVWDGDANVIHLDDQQRVTSKWKPILIFSKGGLKRAVPWTDLSHVLSREKEWHDWQQPLEEVEMLIRTFSRTGDLVVDPCGGGFTTAIACHRLGRRFVGCDIDKAAVASGQERLAKERQPVTIKIDPVVVNSVTEGDCIDLIPRPARWFYQSGPNQPSLCRAA